MWFPEMFNRFDEWSRNNNNAEADICTVTSYVVKMGSHSNATLCDSNIHTDVFQDSLITVAAAIPSNIFAVLGMDRLGRKFFLGKACYSVCGRRVGVDLCSTERPAVGKSGLIDCLKPYSY